MQQVAEEVEEELGEQLTLFEKDFGAMSGKLSKFFKENTLMAQDFVKNSDQSIEELIVETSAKTGEKIGVDAAAAATGRTAGAAAARCWSQSGGARQERRDASDARSQQQRER